MKPSGVNRFQGSAVQIVLAALVVVKGYPLVCAVTQADAGTQRRGVEALVFDDPAGPFNEMLSGHSNAGARAHGDIVVYENPSVAGTGKPCPFLR